MRNEPLFSSFDNFAVYIIVMVILSVIVYRWDCNVHRQFFELWEQDMPADSKVTGKMSTRIVIVLLFVSSLGLAYYLYINKHASEHFSSLEVFGCILYFGFLLFSVFEGFQFIEIKNNVCTVRNSRLQTQMLCTSEIKKVRFFITIHSSKSAPYIDIIDKNDKKVIWGLSVSLENYVFLLKFFTMNGVKVEDEFGILKGWFEKQEGK